MKSLRYLVAACTLAVLPPSHANNNSVNLYINQNIGFNVEGYKYTQKSFPCKLDQVLVGHLLEESQQRQLNAEAVATADKINNGVIPVLALDVEQLVLTEEVQYGPKSSHPLPKVQVMAALVKGEKSVTAPHMCAITTLSEFTSSSNILDMGTVATVCTAVNRCLQRLSDDVVDWLEPQLK